MPIVFATLSLTSAPRKLSPAPSISAENGVSTRVQTAVAIALAASFQPLLRLNSSAPAMTRIVTKLKWSIVRRGQECRITIDSITFATSWHESVALSRSP